VLRARVVALACGLALAGSTGAVAASPALMLAKSLKASMQASYDKSYPGLELTTVSCVIAADGRSAHCQAHFTISAQRLDGLFQVSALIDRTTGGVHTRTLSVACTDAKTGTHAAC
jgi:hypothetical protein